MKTNETKLVLITLFSGLLMLLYSETALFGQDISQNERVTHNPSAYLGIGLAVNDYGLGLGLEIPISNHISFMGNAGLGGWGWKVGCSINIYPGQISDRSEFSLGYSHASGLQDFKEELWIEPNDTKQVLNLDLNKVETINLIYTYNLKIGNSCKAGFSAGYAIRVSTTPYLVKTTGVVLSSTSEQLMNIMEPGGVIVGIRFMFGI